MNINPKLVLFNTISTQSFIMNERKRKSEQATGRERERENYQNDHSQ